MGHYVLWRSFDIISVACRGCFYCAIPRNSLYSAAIIGARSSKIRGKELGVNKQRPINLDLRTIKFPIPAIISILHRISGLALFFMIPFALCALALSLRSAEGFHTITTAFDCLWVKALVWLMLAGLIYHLVAGVRHLLMDLGIGDSLAAGRLSAKLVFIISIVLIVAVGSWLW